MNKQALTLEETEQEIRAIIKTEYFKGSSWESIAKRVKQVILLALREIELPVLKDAGYRSLVNFYQRQKREISKVKPLIFGLAYALNTLSQTHKSAVKGGFWALEIAKKQGIQVVNNVVNYPSANIYGVPLQKFADDYYKENVKPTIDRLAEQYSLDPDDLSGRNSLRNRAEMEVRYNAHTQNIEELKSKGVKLCIASTHTDCSERCAKWQGRVYSLDKTSGTTPDKRAFIPIETATDVYYTTKAGKTYKNGLLGFNCRHYLVEYKDGLHFGKSTEEEEKKQYEITLQQREYEREIRKWKIKAIESKGSNDKDYNYAKSKVAYLTNKYEEFCKKHGRAFYRSRIKV
ncbi:MAG: hypothetical protein KBS91_02595 [Firmicutes bacterium]|nr:hypothetical protein [Candidatus Caballimonas caccae]